MNSYLTYIFVTPLLLIASLGSMVRISVLMLFIILLARTYVYADQSMGFDHEKIRNSLSKLHFHKELLLKGSAFGQHEILFFNPVTEEGFVAEAQVGDHFYFAV